MFIKGIAIFLQFILLQSANEIKENKRATLFTFGSPPFYIIITFLYKTYLLLQNTGVSSNSTAKNSRRPTSIWNALNHFTATGNVAKESIGP